MNTKELKLELFKNIELLDDAELRQVYSLIQKIVGAESNKQWDTLSKEQQEGLLKAIEEMKHTEGTEHQYVMSKYREKYA